MFSEADFQTAAHGMFHGPDLEWFAVDDRDQIGAFCDSGFACVPVPVFAPFDLYIRMLDAIDALTVACIATWYRTQPPIHDRWDNWSPRGLFGFDWDHAIGRPALRCPVVS
jgi:hypothetical protein